MTMKAFYTLVLFIAAAFGFATYKSWEEGQKAAPSVVVAQKTDAYALPDIAQQQYVRRDMTDGTVLIEATNLQQTRQTPENLQAIAPAAGGNEGSVKYDPLTQTYRRSTIDSNGNPSQEIIQAPAKR